VNVAPLNRSLDQELAALTRGASLECLVCGEFVLHARRGVIACPECGSTLVEGAADDLDLSQLRLEFESQAG
jgi:hypothetical protein